MDYPRAFVEVASELCSIPQQKERLEYIMDYGQGMEELEEDKRTDDNIVPGCIARVYIDCTVKNGRVYFKGYSDSLIIKGYVRILCEAFSEIRREEFLEESREMLERFIKESSITESLLPSRANTFGSIYSSMKNKALMIE